MFRKSKPGPKVYNDIQWEMRKDSIKRGIGCSLVIASVMALFGAFIYYMPEDAARNQSIQQRDARRGK